MRCYKCEKEKVSEEIEGAMGIKVIYCCDEYHVDINSVKPKARQAIIIKDEYILDLLSECLSKWRAR